MAHEMKRFEFVIASCGLILLSLSQSGCVHRDPRYAQVQTLYQHGLYREALPIQIEIVKEDKQLQRPESLKTVSSLVLLANLYYETGDYTNAESLYLRELRINEMFLRPDHQNIADNLIVLARLYQSMGEYVKSELLFQRALKILEKNSGPEHQAIAKTLNNLAELYRTMGDCAKAEPLYERALKITEKSLGSNHPTAAVILHNQGLLYDTMGDYAKAEPLLQQALKIMEKTPGPDHPNTANCLNDLALLYLDLRDYAKAEPLLQRALKIYEKARGLDHPDTANCLINLAGLYEDMRDNAKEEPLILRALEINGHVLGTNHPATATCLTYLARMKESKGEYAKAEPLFQQALNIRERALGADNPFTAMSVNNLAHLYWCQGDYTNAERLFRRALKIDETVLGLDNPETLARLDNLSCALLDLGRISEALELLVKEGRGRLKMLGNILSFASEQQRLDYQSRLQNICYSLIATVGSAPPIAAALFCNKGVVLDSLLEDRLITLASQNPQDRAVIDQLRVAKQRLTQLLLERPKDLSGQSLQNRLAMQGELSQDVEQMESALARHVTGLGHARRALITTVAEVQAAIPAQASLIEFLRYDHYQGSNTWEMRYGAIVLGASGEPQWVGLGSAEDIENSAKLFQQFMRGSAGESELSSVLHAIYQQLWSQIEPHLPAGTTTVIISPDAQLNFISFATLLTPDDQFLCQKYSIRYVASGRDLLREVKTGTNSEMLLFADPDFSSKGAAPANSTTNDLLAQRSLEVRDLQNLYLPPLPGTAAESAALAAQARQWHWPVRVFTNAAATEAQLAAARSPHILHLATHGFFLPETDSEATNAPAQSRGWELIKSIDVMADPGSPDRKAVFLKNPMYRSGLALAGAQTTLDAWKRGEVPPMDNDGIVTAEEVGGLKLEGTWLVVLSACDTGTGEARSGEGVMGLRRGFIQAGAQNLLMTLWSVADEDTANLMVDFYSAMHKSGNAPESLANVQRDWLIKLRRDRGLANAVRVAGPFIMSSQGAVK